MSAFDDAWALLKKGDLESLPQATLKPYGYTSGNPEIDSRLPDSFPAWYSLYSDPRLFMTKPVPQYGLDVKLPQHHEGMFGEWNHSSVKPSLLADGEKVGEFPMGSVETDNLKRLISTPRGTRDVVAHTTMPFESHHDGLTIDQSDIAIPEKAFYPVGSKVDDEHKGKGLYIRSLLSLLSTPDAMGLSAKDVAREQRTGSEDEYELKDLDPELFNELYGTRGLMSPPSRSSGKGGSNRSHQLLNEQYKRIMDLPGGFDRHTFGEGEFLSNIIDMAERGEGMFGRGVGGKLKHNLLEGSFGELRYPSLEELKTPRGKTYFYDPIPVDVGKVGDEVNTFGDLRRFDLAGLPVKVKRPFPRKWIGGQQTNLKDHFDIHEGNLNLLSSHDLNNQEHPDYHTPAFQAARDKIEAEEAAKEASRRRRAEQEERLKERQERLHGDSELLGILEDHDRRQSRYQDEEGNWLSDEEMTVLPDIDLGDGPVSAQSIINREQERRESADAAGDAAMEAAIKAGKNTAQAAAAWLAAWANHGRSRSFRGRAGQPGLARRRRLREASAAHRLAQARGEKRALARRREQEIQDTINSLGNLFDPTPRQMRDAGISEERINKDL